MPNLLWVEQTAPPVPTTPRAWDQCYGCDCLVPFPGSLIDGGNIADRFTCHGSGPKPTVPEFKWAGAPVNSGQGHVTLRNDGVECDRRDHSFAITMEDMDYPYGVGEVANTARNVFWAVNIPGDWTEFNEAAAGKTHEGENIVTVGRNQEGQIGLELPCPHKGVHRFKVTLWSLDGYAGNEVKPVTPDSSFYNEILPWLEGSEMQRAVFYGSVTSPGYKPGDPSPGQRTGWLRGAHAP